MKTSFVVASVAALALCVGCDDGGSAKPTANRPTAPSGGSGPPVPVSTAPPAPAPVANASTDNASAAPTPAAAPDAATTASPPAAAPAGPVSLGTTAGGAAPPVTVARGGFRIGARPAQPAAEEPPAEPPAADAAPAAPPPASAATDQSTPPPAADSPGTAPAAAPPAAEPEPAATTSTDGSSLKKLKPFNFGGNDNPPANADDAASDAAKGKAKTKKPAKSKTAKAKPTDPDETAPKNVKAGSTKKAEAGVGKKGRDYGKGYVAVALATRWTAEQRLIFEAQIPKAMQLFKATNGYAPRSHKEFMKEIIQANLIKLPELPDGEEYLYDKDTEKLMVYEVEDQAKK